MSNLEKEQWYNWYKNIVLYFKYRGETLPNVLSKEAFVKEMINSNLVNIKTDKIHVILTAPKQKFSSLNNDMKKKINEILLADSVDEIMYICDITLVGEKGVNYNQTVKKVLEEFKDNNDRIWVQMRPYSLFINNIPECSEIVKHRRLDQKAVREELELTHTPLVSLIRTKEWDPPVVWLGARAGEIIAVERLSGSVGTQTVLKRVIL
jgi:DNA-directed RNA polymerase subunit H (RpoH/RPB5)